MKVWDDQGGRTFSSPQQRLPGPLEKDHSYFCLIASHLLNIKRKDKAAVAEQSLRNAAGPVLLPGMLTPEEWVRFETGVEEPALAMHNPPPPPHASTSD